MTEEKLNIEELEGIIDFEEISDEELGDVTGGTFINKKTGAFSTKREAELFAETKFRVGAYYKYNKTEVVQCISTGAEMKNGVWYAVCYFKNKSGCMGKATMNFFV